MESQRNSEIRRDVFFNKFVIFSPSRGQRPSDFKSRDKSSNNTVSCPFCIGRENECAPEIFRIPEGASDWKIRVIENLYPALQRTLDPPNCSDLHSSESLVLSGFGVHDVVIESPYHHIRLSDLSDSEIAGVLLAFKERIEQLEKGGFIKYVQVFKNHGSSAGASMSHSHSQIIGLPFIPPTVSMRLNSMKYYLNETGKCAVCEVKAFGELIVDRSQHFYSVAPFAASFPFEIWIVPREHGAHFHEIDCEKAVDLGWIMKLTLRKLASELDDPPFNFMIHSSPISAEICGPSYLHWFIQIMPHLSVVGGFEIGTGCYINTLFPEDAARALRDANISIS